MSAGGAATAPSAERLDAARSADLQRRFAGALAAAGLSEGDRVVLAVAPCAETLSAAVGATRVGVVPVMLNPSLLPGEVAGLVADADPGLVVDTRRALDELLEAPPADLAPWPRCRPMHYTSGTTGRPKGVWSGVLSDADAEELFADEADLWGFAAGDTHLVCAPLHHSAPLRFATAALLRGGAVVVLPRFDAASVVEAINEHRPSTAFMAPTHLRRLTDRSGGAAPIDAADLSSFRLLAHAGERCPEELKREVMGRFPPGVVWEFYGSTEGQFSVCSPDEWLERPGTVGRARPGRRLAVDDAGVIWCAAPPFARFAYWRDDDKTASCWTRLPDGSPAFTVGDLGRLDADGYLWVDGRRDDLIISGGVNVYPAEVEAALAGLPGVSEVAVFGLPDQRWGQRVCAAVIGDVDSDAVRRRAADSLAAYKRPKDVYLVGDLPRTSTGKVRRGRVARFLGLEADAPDPHEAPGGAG